MSTLGLLSVSILTPLRRLVLSIPSAHQRIESFTPRSSPAWDNWRVTGHCLSTVVADPLILTISGQETGLSPKGGAEAGGPELDPKHPSK